MLKTVRDPGRINVKLADENNCNKTVIKQVVNIHMRTFDGFFLTFLGEGFLCQLYQGFCRHPQSGLIIAEQQGRIVGFLAYSEDLSGFYKYLIKTHLVPFAWYSAGAMVRKPSIMIRLIRAFHKPGESIREERYVELSSIGVLPEMKNNRVGSLMIEKLKSIFDNQRFEYIKLETDAENNEAANHFYEKNGFIKVGGYETPEGRRMNEYRYR